jgi:hypothetical protein
MASLRKAGDSMRRNAGPRPARSFKEEPASEMVPALFLWSDVSSSRKNLPDLLGMGYSISQRSNPDIYRHRGGKQKKNKRKSLTGFPNRDIKFSKMKLLLVI